MPHVAVLVCGVWAIGDLVLQQAGHVSGLLQQSLEFPYSLNIFPGALACPIDRFTNEPHRLAHFLVADAIPC
jgi:hypothetical protein